MKIRTILFSAAGAVFGIGVVGYAILAMLGVFNSYVAIYTVTGDLYFGVERPFPYQKLSDVHIIQPPQTEDGAPSLQPLRNAPWEPEGALSLNEKNVVWQAELSRDSQIVRYLKGDTQPLPQGIGENIPGGMPQGAQTQAQ